MDMEVGVRRQDFFIVKLEFDPLLVPTLSEREKNTFCDMCLKKIKPKIIYAVSPHFKFVEDVLGDIHNYYEFPGEIELLHDGFHISSKYPVAVLRAIQGVITVTPVRTKIQMHYRCTGDECAESRQRLKLKTASPIEAYDAGSNDGPAAHFPSGEKDTLSITDVERDNNTASIDQTAWEPQGKAVLPSSSGDSSMTTDLDIGSDLSFLGLQEACAPRTKDMDGGSTDGGPTPEGNVTTEDRSKSLTTAFDYSESNNHSASGDQLTLSITEELIVLNEDSSDGTARGQQRNNSPSPSQITLTTPKFLFSNNDLGTVAIAGSSASMSNTGPIKNLFIVSEDGQTTPVNVGYFPVFFLPEAKRKSDVLPIMDRTERPKRRNSDTQAIVAPKKGRFEDAFAKISEYVDDLATPIKRAYNAIINKEGDTAGNGIADSAAAEKTKSLALKSFEPEDYAAQRHWRTVAHDSGSIQPRDILKFKRTEAGNGTDASTGSEETVIVVVDEVTENFVVGNVVSPSSDMKQLSVSKEQITDAQVWIRSDEDDEGDQLNDMNGLEDHEELL